MKKLNIILLMLFRNLDADENLKQIFNNIYINNLWNNIESVSGPGSTLHRTNNLRNILPNFLKKYDVKILLDAPCGDLNWIKEIINQLNLEKYIGADIVTDLIKNNKKKFETSNIDLLNLDIINDELPKADLILCRDCFIHLSKNDIFKAIKNFKKSGSRYLLMTQYTDNIDYLEINTGDFRILNFKLEPFNFSEPIEQIPDNENYPSVYKNKYLALWNLNDIKI